MGAGNVKFPAEREPLSFRDWADVLERAPLPAGGKERCRREILAFLRACKVAHAPATVAFARQYVATKDSARAPLLWFFSRGAAVDDLQSVVPATTRSRASHPPPAADDLGRSGWDQATVKALREKGLLWRTEQTFRAWGRQFDAFLRPRSVETADAREVGAFLSHLAVTQRASWTEGGAGAGWVNNKDAKGLRSEQRNTPKY